MSSTATREHIAGLLATFNIEIGSLPDGLMCGQCRGVLKDACQVPCGCRLCRACIDEEVARGTQFCPGGAQECRGTHLSTAVPDYRANKTISRLTGKCPHAGCPHECPLADMEAHLRACPGTRGNRVQCERGGRQESGGPSEVLVGLVANLGRDMDSVRSELAAKDEQMKSIMDEMGHVQNENKLIKDDNKSMKELIESVEARCNLIGRENEALSERVRRLAEKLDRAIDDRGEAGELASVRAATIGATMGSSRDALESGVEPARGDIGSIKRDTDFLKGQVQSARAAAGPGRVDARCDEWLIDEDVARASWGWSWTSLFGALRAYEGPRTSDTFGATAGPHTYQLASWNRAGSGVLGIRLRIWAGPEDALLHWPFRGAVTVTVAHRDRRHTCSRQTRQCRIERPPDNRYSGSDIFRFPHAALRGAGIDLARGVCVSCQIELGVTP